MRARKALARKTPGLKASLFTALGSAALLVGSTAGATAAVNQAPGTVPTSFSVPKGEDPGTAAGVPAVAAGTGGPIRVLLVGDSEASFLGFGLGPESDRYDVQYAGDGVFGCGLLTYPTSFHGTVVDGDVGERGGHVPVPCDTQLARWRADVEAFHPDVVLVADGEYEVRDQRIGDSWQHIGTPAVDSMVSIVTSADEHERRNLAAWVLMQVDGKEFAIHRLSPADADTEGAIQ